MRYAIVYVSTASETLDENEIKQILTSTEECNNKNNITGLLLFSEGNFFQVIEGDKQVIMELFENIKEDDRHHNILQIFGKDIHKEAYDGYTSDFVSEVAEYDQEKFQHYLNHIKVLDKTSQIVVENIIKAFLIY